MNILEGLKCVFLIFCATLGFSVLLRAPARSRLPASLNGAAVYLIFWLLVNGLGLDVTWSILAAVTLGAITAQILSKKLKMAGVVLSTLAFVPLIPGLTVYQAMEEMGMSNTAAGTDTLIFALMQIAMIAVGIGLGTFFGRLIINGGKLYAVTVNKLKSLTAFAIPQRPAPRPAQDPAQKPGQEPDQKTPNG